MQSYYATEVYGVTETYGGGSIYIDILSHTEFKEIANYAVVPKDDANKYVPLKDLNEDAVKCVGHVKQTCAGLMTAELSEASLADGVCNPALNVPECGWDCGVLWGATAGLLGGRWDNWMMRTVDVLYSLPSIIFVIVIITTLEGVVKGWVESAFGGDGGETARHLLLYAGLL